MLNKDKLNDYIKRKFPDLDKTSIKLGDKVPGSWIESKLLPYLFYQNTIDNKRRIISLYLPEASTSKNLLPVYLALGFYRKTINDVLVRYNYKTDYTKDEKQVVYKGAVCKVRLLDFISRQIHLQEGTGSQHVVPFNDLYELRWQYKNAEDIWNSIIEYQKYSSGEDDIFNCQISPDEEDFTGAILFTSKKASIKEVLKNVYINEKHILKYLHIQEVVYDKGNDKYKFQSLSTAKGVISRPISLVIASEEDFNAFDNIKKQAEGKFNHINTVVFSDFDELVKKSYRNNNEDVLKDSLHQNYFQVLDEEDLMDVFLVNKNYNLDIETWLNDSLEQEINKQRFCWLVNPVERISIEGYSNSIQHDVEFHAIRDKEYVNFINEINRFINKWMGLAEECPCNEESLIGAEILFDIRNRLNSFFHPSKFREDIQNYIKKLMELQDKWFGNGSDNGLINETNSLLRTMCDEEVCNCNQKLKYLLNYFKPERRNTKLLIITGRKLSEEDTEYFKQSINEISPSAECEFKFYKDNITEVLTLHDIYDYCILFTFREKYRTAPLVNIYAKRHHFLLNSLEYGYAKREIIRKTFPIIESLTDIRKKLDLLNLDYSFGETMVLSKPNFIENQPDEQMEPEREYMEVELESFDFDAFVESVLSKRSETDLCYSKEIPEVMIFMDDGSYYRYPDHKMVFVYGEDLSSIDQARKSVGNLSEGDTIFFVKSDGDVKDTIFNLLKSKPEFEKIVHDNQEWRDKLEQKADTLNNDMCRLNALLEENDFPISLSVPNEWINGNTTRPHNFDKLLITLVKMDVIHKQKIPDYLKAVKTVKSIQITFVREAIKKMIAYIDNIPYTSNNRLINDEIIDEFMERVELKKVNTVIKLKNAN